MIEVKLYRGTSENIPSFPNIDEVYGENPRPRRLLEECSAIPVGILLEMSKPSNARIPYYIVEVDGVNGRKAHDAIYASIAEWCRARRIPLATT